MIISLDDIAIAEGTEATLDVTLTSDNPAGDRLFLFNFDFQIVGEGLGRVQFVSPQSDLALSDDAYVFAGRSGSLAFPPLGNVSTTLFPGDTYRGGDFLLAGDEMLITDQDVFLLARLTLTAAAPSPARNGDEFVVQFVPGDFGYFLDGLFHEVPFRSRGGSVSVTALPRLIGDANRDGAVGAADYALWAAQFGEIGLGLPADFDHSGDVGAADYALWAANFGQSAASQSNLAALAVPEPGLWTYSASTLVLLMAQWCCVISGAYGRRGGIPRWNRSGERDAA